MSYYSRISSSAVGVREEVLACIANLTELPTEITALETLKQLTIRLTD
jgi:DNA-directed RNA polymerase alpha subunit